MGSQNARLAPSQRKAQERSCCILELSKSKSKTTSTFVRPQTSKRRTLDAEVPRNKLTSMSNGCTAYTWKPPVTPSGELGSKPVSCTVHQSGRVLQISTEVKYFKHSEYLQGCSIGVRIRLATVRDEPHQRHDIETHVCWLQPQADV